MSWSARQLEMLVEMGLTSWAPMALSREPTSLPESAQAAAARAPRLPDEPAARPIPGASPPAALQASPSARPVSPTPQRESVQGLVSRPERPLTPPVARSRPVGVGEMGWNQLTETVAGCRACKLCENRTQAVFGVGSTRAHWMVVGEAPGEQEDRLGEPFVGKSGQLLDNMLRAIGLTRSDTLPDGGTAPSSRQVYIANTVKCRPPGNRNPEPEELAQCEPYLIQQIELLQPRIILAMGRFAVQSLLRSQEPIGRLRGRVHEYQGVPLVVTYHPAYLLRNPDDKSKAWQDLCLAKRTGVRLAQARPAP